MEKPLTLALLSKVKDDYYKNVFQMTDHLHASGAKGHNIFTMGSKLLTITHFSSIRNSIQVIYINAIVDYYIQTIRKKGIA